LANAIDVALDVEYFQGDLSSIQQLETLAFTPTTHVANNTVAWIKLTVHNHTDKKQNVMLLNHLAYLSEKVTLFDGKYLQKPLATYNAYSPVDNEQFIANIWQQTFELTPNQTRIFYLRNQTIVSQVHKFSLHHVNDTAKVLASHNMFATAIIAVLLALAFYNLTLFCYGESKALLYYFIYLLNGGIGLAYMYGLLFQFSDNYRHWLSWFNLTAIMVPAFLALFTQFALDIKKHSSTANKLLIAVIAVCLINFAIAIIFGLATGMKFITVSFLFSFIIVIFIAREMLLKGHALINVFIIAYLIYIVGMGLTIAGLHGLLPFQAYQFYASGIGLIIEAILFSYLLHYRSTLLQQEVSRQTQLQKELRRIVEHDELTQVATRRAFDRVAKSILQQSILNNSRFSLMFIDIDGFKEINDNLGHQVGDLVLRNVAKKLQGCLRHSDLLARVGGDEFVILLPCVYKQRDIEKVSIELLKQIQNPLTDFDKKIDIGISIGIATYPEHGNTIEELIKKADDAMYHVKQNGKNNWQTYD